MTMTEYKTKKTEKQCVKELNDGKKVLAKDLMSAMGIKVVEIK